MTQERIYGEWLREVFDIIKNTGYTLYNKYDEYKDSNHLKEEFDRGDSPISVAEILVMQFESLE